MFLDILQINMDDFGVDWDGPIPTDLNSDNHVEVPDTNFHLIWNS